MTGLYIHIPFCKQACSYCDFHFSTNQKMRSKIVSAINKELSLRKEEVSGPISSIYFGGGTPSILNQEELSSIFEHIHKHYNTEKVSEITLETNPDDHSEAQLKFWKSLGINRLSIGIQSFIDRDLKLMNRAHNAAHARECIKSAKAAGFEHLTIDLIYGIPHQTFEEWQENVEMAIGLETEHISAYCLTVEEKTALHHQVEKGLIREKSDEEIEQEYLHLHNTLEAAGFIHYEISNYAKPGSTATHNSNYWKSQPYIGIGPSAHSFDGKNVRRWNVANNIAYMKFIEAGQSYFETETLRLEDQLNEYLMTHLRTKAGILFSEIPEALRPVFMDQLNELPRALKEKMAISESGASINPEHWLMADAVIRELMI